jgi:hypothetical protein
MSADLGRTEHPVARKVHCCESCARVIAKGEKYTRWTGKWDDEFSTYAECEQCSLAVKLWEIENADGAHNMDTFSDWEPRTVTELRAKEYWRREWTRPDGTRYEVPRASPKSPAEIAW